MDKVCASEKESTKGIVYPLGVWDCEETSMAWVPKLGWCRYIKKSLFFFVMYSDPTLDYR